MAADAELRQVSSKAMAKSHACLAKELPVELTSPRSKRIGTISEAPIKIARQPDFVRSRKSVEYTSQKYCVSPRSAALAVHTRANNKDATCFRLDYYHRRSKMCTTAKVA